MNATEILVIILSSFLALFLIVGIILTVLLIRITVQIKKVTTSAEKTVNNIQSMTDNASKMASIGLIAKMATSQFKKIRTKK